MAKNDELCQLFFEQAIERHENGLGPLILPFDTKQAATATRFQLNAYRRKMVDEGKASPNWDDLTLRIDEHNRIIAEFTIEEFENALSAALGKEISELKPKSATDLLKDILESGD